MAEFNFKQKPSGIFKRVLHAPTWVYRAHLGFLFGHRFLMIEHRGRKSGNLYRTVLEVAGRYPEKGEWVVTSGTGPKAASKLFESMGVSYDGTDEGRIELMHRIPMVSFSLA